MKVGSLVYDSYYGNGIVLEVWKDEGVVINFTESKRVCFLDQHMLGFVEVISEAR
jgi:hypothetical protein